MEFLDKEDIVWLNVVEFFALSEADVILARYILMLHTKMMYKPRVFSEHNLVEKTGWTEYVIRRILGHWQSMGMAKAKPPPTRPSVVSTLRFGSGLLCNNRMSICRRKHTVLKIKLSIANVPLDKNRIERCAQEWEVDTGMFYNSFHKRICWIRQKSQSTFSEFICGCNISDPAQHIPNDDCTALICQICNSEVKEEHNATRFNLMQTALYQTYEITNGSSFKTWTFPLMPESLRLRRSEERNGEAEVKEEVNEEVNEEVKEEYMDSELMVQGVSKRLSELTDDDLQMMTESEFQVYVNLCEGEEDEGEEDEEENQWED
jgi:hypothetical protein